MSDNNLLKNTKNLVLLIIGTFENSKVELFFKSHFDNIICCQTKNDALSHIKTNKVDIALCSNNNSFNTFTLIEKVRLINETIPLFISSNILDSEELLKSIEFKIDGYLLESLCEDILLKQISKSIKKLTEKKNNDLYLKYFNAVNENIIISKELLLM
jgi:DNA-binding NarL/FixJ family response regulator